MRQKYGNNIPSGLKSETELDILDGFVRGLLPQIRDRLEAQRYTDLTDATDKAVNISKIIQIDNKRLGNRINNYNEIKQNSNRNQWNGNQSTNSQNKFNSREKNRYGQSRNFNQNSTNNNRSQNFSRDNRQDNQYNQSANNYANQRNFNNMQRNVNVAIPSSNQHQNNNNPVCRYCKNPGHTLEQCRKRIYNNNQARSSENNNNNQNRQNSGNNYNSNNKNQGTNQIKKDQTHVNFLEEQPPDGNPPPTSQSQN